MNHVSPYFVRFDTQTPMQPAAMVGCIVSPSFASGGGLKLSGQKIER